MPEELVQRIIDAEQYRDKAEQGGVQFTAKNKTLEECQDMQN